MNQRLFEHRKASNPGGVWSVRKVYLVEHHEMPPVAATAIVMAFEQAKYNSLIQVNNDDAHRLTALAGISPPMVVPTPQRRWSYAGRRRSLPSRCSRLSRSAPDDVAGRKHGEAPAEVSPCLAVASQQFDRENGRIFAPGASARPLAHILTQNPVRGVYSFSCFLY